jgi:SPFH domain / Band 7 family
LEELTTSGVKTWSSPSACRLLILLAALVASSLRILREYERGVVFQLGRFWRIKGPGLVILVAGIQQMVRIDLRIVVMDVPSQDVISRDNVTLKVSAVLYFRIVDPERAVIQVEQFLAATSQLAQTTLRAVLGKHTLDEMLSERERLNLDLQKILDSQTGPPRVGLAQPGLRPWCSSRPRPVVHRRRWQPRRLHFRRKRGLQLRRLGGALRPVHRSGVRQHRDRRRERRGKHQRDARLDRQPELLRRQLQRPGAHRPDQRRIQWSRTDLAKRQCDPAADGLELQVQLPGRPLQLNAHRIDRLLYRQLRRLRSKRAQHQSQPDQVAGRAGCGWFRN